jgi:hypothetical protein
VSQKLSIVALGWLGSTVYDHFSEELDCSGSYHSKIKNYKNEYQFDINNYKELPLELLSADIVLINLPPSKIEDLIGFKQFVSKIKDKRVILISSTSVYEQSGYVDEASDLLRRSSRATRQLHIEDIVISEVTNHMILRCAGLYSKDRHPGYYLSGKTNISGANNSINLVSKEDIISILDTVLLESEQKIINLVNINHPKKDEYYNEFCRKRDLDRVEFNHERTADKIVGTKYPQFKIESPLP